MRTLLTKFLLRVFALLPFAVSQRTGAVIGRLIAVLPNDLKHTAEVNLERCFPAMPAPARAELLRRSLVETGKAVAEAGPVLLWKAERVLGLVRGVSGEHHIEAALNKGCGVILITPHLGAWEVAGLYCSARYPMTILYRPPQLKVLHTLLHRSRTRLGARVVPTDPRGLRRLYRSLAEGGTVGMLPDQDPGRRSGVFAPFFGIPAKTTTLLARLALRSRARVICGIAERLPRAGGFHIRFQPMDSAIDNANLETAATALNQAVEKYVMRLPEQYQWCYKRFRSRPVGEAAFYRP